MSSSITAYFLTLVKFFLHLFFKCCHNEVLRGKGMKQISSGWSLEMEVTVSVSFWWPEWTILRNLRSVTQFYWKEPVVPSFLNSSVFSYVLWFLCVCVFLLSFLCLSISGASAGDGVCPCLNHSGQNDNRKEWVKHDGVSFCWFKDPEAEGKRELENDRIK